MGLHKPNQDFAGVDVSDDIVDSQNGLTIYDVLAGRVGSDVRKEQRTGTLTANATISQENQIVGVDTGGGVVTITLASSMVSDGNWIVVSDEGGAAGTNAITVATEGSETVDGGADATIGSNYGSFLLYTNGVDWFTTASTGGGGTL